MRCACAASRRGRSWFHRLTFRDALFWFRVYQYDRLQTMRELALIVGTEVHNLGAYWTKKFRVKKPRDLYPSLFPDAAPGRAADRDSILSRHAAAVAREQAYEEQIRRKRERLAREGRTLEEDWRARGLIRSEQAKTVDELFAEEGPAARRFTL